MALVSRWEELALRTDGGRGREHLGTAAGGRPAKAVDEFHFRRNLRLQLDFRWKTIVADSRRKDERCRAT